MSFVTEAVTVSEKLIGDDSECAVDRAFSEENRKKFHRC